MSKRAEWYADYLDRKHNGVPLRAPQRLHIDRNGVTLATVYPRHGETLEAAQERAQRMAAAYGGEVVNDAQ